jgi:hypothetical protein
MLVLLTLFAFQKVQFTTSPVRKVIKVIVCFKENIYIHFYAVFFVDMPILGHLYATGLDTDPPMSTAHLGLSFDKGMRKTF